MKRMLALATLVCAASLAHADAADEAAARVPVENYLRGHATGDGSFWRQAFHADARIRGYSPDGKMHDMSAAEFLALASGHPAPDEAQRRRSIERFEVTGNVAEAKVILDYPTVRFTDYLSLLKVNGEWKIVHKTYFGQRKPPAAAH